MNHITARASARLIACASARLRTVFLVLLASIALAVPLSGQAETCLEKHLTELQLRIRAGSSAAPEPRVEDLEPASLNGIVIRRQKLCFDGEECVVLVEKPKFHGPIPKGMEDDLRHMGGTRIQDPRLAQPAMVNCHAYSCLIESIPGVRPSMWIDGVSGAHVGSANPMRLILNRFFDRIATFRKHTEWEIPLQKGIQEGDMVVLFDEGDIVRHSGILVRREGKLELLSKLGEDDIFVMPVDMMPNLYRYRSYGIFRRK